MKTEVVDVSATRKELRIEIDAQAVRAEYDRVSNRYLKQARVPGFRPGHAPLSIVRQRYRSDIRSDVLRELIPQAISEALTESALNVIGEPDIHLDNEESLNRIGEEPIAIHAHVEVIPKISLGQYTELSVERRVRPVTDEDVDGIVNALRESSASLQPVEDREAQLGDTVTVDFDGKFVQTPDAEDIHVDEVDVELGGEGVLPEIRDNLVGVKPDDEKQFTVHYPEDFNAEGLAGKEVAYTAKVIAVRRREVPELNDEWAKSVGEDVESLEGLRARVRENLTKRASLEADSEVRDQVMEKLIEATPLEIPETLVNIQSQQLLESSMRDMIRRGIDPRREEIDWSMLRDALAKEAGRQVHGSLLLETVADKEGIAATDEEVEEEISVMAEALRQTPDQVRATLTKQGGERSIADRLTMRKTLDFLQQKAVVSEGEWREEMPSDETAEDASGEAPEGETKTAQAATTAPEQS